jgi:hypothetical protein
MLEYTNCGDIFAGELVRCVADQQASLTDCSITNHDALDGLHYCPAEKSDDMLE